MDKYYLRRTKLTCKLTMDYQFKLILIYPRPRWKIQNKNVRVTKVVQKSFSKNWSASVGVKCQINNKLKIYSVWLTAL